MPNIAVKGTKWSVVFDEQFWLNGLNTQYSNAVTKKMGVNLGFAQNVDPYRNFGFLNPGYNPTDLENVSVIDALQKEVVVNGSKAYSVGGTKVHQLDLSSDGDITTPTTFPHTVSAHGGHSAVVLQDVIVYPMMVSSSRVNRLFYAWNDNTDGDIGMHDFSTTFDDDWLSTVPASGAVLAGTNVRRLIIGSDDILYCSEGNLVRGIDGSVAASGQNLGTVLTLPKGYVITGFAKLSSSDSLVIFAYRDASQSGSSFFRGEAKAFFWDYLSLDPYKIVDLGDNYVDGAFEYEGTVGCFTEGRDLTAPQAKLKIFNGDTFDTVVSFSDSVPIKGGVDVVGKTINWNVKGKIYSYGSEESHSKKEAPIVLQHRTSGSGSSSGLLRSLSSNIRVISSGATTSGGLQNITDNYTTGQFHTSTIYPEFPFGFEGKIDYVRIVYGAASSNGRGITIALKRQGGTNIAEIIPTATPVTTVTAGELIKDFTRDASGNYFNNTFESLALAGTWTAGSGATDAPRISRVEVHGTLRRVARS